MKKQSDLTERRGVPRIGQRIVKTALAVFLCLLYYYLRGYRGQEIPAEAAITAIICMQPYVRDTRDYAISRFAGTLIGTVCGLLFLLFFLVFPALASYRLLVYVLMGLGVVSSLHSAVLLRRPDTSGLAAIVFICIVIAFPDIEEPLRRMGDRIFGVLLGTVIAIAVNVFRLPRRKNRSYVFFVRVRDIAPDRFSSIPSAALFRLNYLYNDGAKICLMSEHAPAFSALQMSEAMLSMPLIVMDGAAVFDANENVYLYTETLPVAGSAWLREQLDAHGISYFLYTVRRNKTCIFHQGEIRPPEKAVYERMRRSPYRSYLDGERCEPDEIVYIKVLADEERITELAAKLRPHLAVHGLRAAVRPQSVNGVYGLYVYSEKADMKHAEEKLMELLREKDPSLTPVEVFLRGGYRSEHDAMQLLHTLGNFYEPVALPWNRKKEL
ncbi:MAG: FUSC family protein [Oscillospiraceae bacterium]|nr:FUSC family protein [Oscillospiraceae bacterium]